MKVSVNGKAYEVEILDRQRYSVRFVLDGRNYSVELPASVPDRAESADRVRPTKPSARTRTGGHGGTGLASLSESGLNQVLAPLPGVIVGVEVATGDTVEEGQLLLHIEAMKMHNALHAPCRGTIDAIHVQPGHEVGDGALLLEIRPNR